MGLLLLPQDILEYLAVDHVPQTDLFSLTLTCRHLRRVFLAHLFRRLTFNAANNTAFLEHRLALHDRLTALLLPSPGGLSPHPPLLSYVHHLRLCGWFLFPNIHRFHLSPTRSIDYTALPNATFYRLKFIWLSTLRHLILECVNNLPSLQTITFRECTHHQQGHDTRRHTTYCFSLTFYIPTHLRPFQFVLPPRLDPGLEMARDYMLSLVADPRLHLIHASFGLQHILKPNSTLPDNSQLLLHLQRLQCVINTLDHFKTILNEYLLLCPQLRDLELIASVFPPPHDMPAPHILPETIRHLSLEESLLRYFHLPTPSLVSLRITSVRPYLNVVLDLFLLNPSPSAFYALECLDLSDYYPSGGFLHQIASFLPHLQVLTIGWRELPFTMVQRENATITSMSLHWLIDLASPFPNLRVLNLSNTITSLRGSLSESLTITHKPTTLREICLTTFDLFLQRTITTSTTAPLEDNWRATRLRGVTASTSESPTPAGTNTKSRTTKVWTKLKPIQEGWTLNQALNDPALFAACMAEEGAESTTSPAVVTERKTKGALQRLSKLFKLKQQ